MWAKAGPKENRNVERMLEKKKKESEIASEE